MRTPTSITGLSGKYRRMDIKKVCCVIVYSLEPVFQEHLNSITVTKLSKTLADLTTFKTQTHNETNLNTEHITKLETTLPRNIMHCCFD